MASETFNITKDLSGRRTGNLMISSGTFSGSVTFSCDDPYTPILDDVEIENVFLNGGSIVVTEAWNCPEDSDVQPTLAPEALRARLLSGTADVFVRVKATAQCVNSHGNFVKDLGPEFASGVVNVSLIGRRPCR